MERTSVLPLHLSQALTHKPKAAQAPGQASLAPPQTANQSTDCGLQAFLFVFSSHTDSNPQCPIHTTEPRPPLSPCPVCNQDQLSSFPRTHVILFQHQYAESTRQEGHHKAGLHGQRSLQPWACQHLQTLSPDAPHGTLACHGRATLPPAQHLPIKQLSCSEGHRMFCPSANNPN